MHITERRSVKKCESKYKRYNTRKRHGYYGLKIKKVSDIIGHRASILSQDFANFARIRSNIVTVLSVVDTQLVSLFSIIRSLLPDMTFVILDDTSSVIKVLVFAFKKDL